MDIKQWFNEQNSTAKMMVIFVVMLLIAIATRWSYIEKEASEAVKERLKLDDFRVEGDKK